MAICKGCGSKFQWGFCDGKWVPLEPVESHDDMDRTYVDENGTLRADHRDRHDGNVASINVMRLDRKVPAWSASNSSTTDLREATLREEADLEAASKDVYGSPQ